MSGVQLSKCTAAGNGGGLYGAGNVTLKDGTQFSGCGTTSTTGRGAALYLATTGKSANFYGGDKDGVNGVKITGCSVAAPQGGAVDCANGAKLNFEGNVHILNNRLAGSTDQHNVVLAHDNQTTIHTTAKGLGEDASIGVYVTDERMEKRGNKEKDFGTYGSNSNLDAFMNDRLPLVGGEDANKAIAWSTAYTLVLDPNGGDGTAISVKLTTLKEYTLSAPFTKDGYHFTGWNTRKDGTGDSFSSSDVVNKLTDEDGATVTLYAQWDDYTACGIFFHPNGGTEVPSREVKPGTELGLLPSSMREHYTFVRWMLMNDGVEQSYSQTMPVQTDLHFYALWQKKVAITFDAQGGIVGEEVREMAPGKIGTLPKTEQPAASKRDYTFVRWYALDKDGERYTVTADTEFTANATVYAEWSVIARHLRYNTNGGYPGYDPSTNTHWVDSDPITDLDTIKSYAVQNLPQVTNHGYELDGWYVGSTRISNGSELVDGVTLDLRTQNVATAHWNKLEWVTVTFISDGGSDCNAISVYKGDKADHYPEPTKSGHAFVGWYLLDEAGLFAKDEDGQDIEVNVLTTLTDNITVKAKWESYATVTFDSDGGSACESVSVKKGTRVKSYPTPTKDGYVFAGWYTSEGAEVNDQTTITEDVTVQARWNELVTVTFNWTDYKDADGNPVVTTDTVEKGKSLSMIPGTYREGYVLDGWYPDADYTGEALSASTAITDNVTYYAKWRPSMIEKDEPVKYEFDAKWTDASTSELTNLNDCLTWYVAGSASKTVEAHAYVGFALKETGGKVFSPGSIKIRVPKYVFMDWNGNNIRGTNDIVAYIPKAPATSKTLRWNYIDEGDYYVIQNTETTENVTFDLKITYTANIKDVKAARISNETGQHLDAQGNVLENDDYAPKSSAYTVTVASDDASFTETRDLCTAAYKTYVQTSYTADFSRGSSAVRRYWDSAWGTKPDDADDYYYVVWTHGGFAIHANGDIQGSTSGQFETTSKEWLEDAYEVVYTDAANNYVVTRHPYSELVNNRKTLYKKEVVKGSWTSSGLEETGNGTIPCEVDFRVYEPYRPTPTSESVTGLSASKSYGTWWGYRGFRTGQDSLLDDEPLTTSFSLSMYGPGADNLVQKGDSSLYYANDYTMIVRDGAPGDVTYYSSRANRRVRLGDNDYNVTRLSISLSNSDGYKDESGWHSLANTAYSSWKPVEVWLRRAGEVEYYKYTDVYITNNSAKTVVLPSDTVGFEVRHSTFYWRTHLSVSPTIRINATTHVKNLVQPDYLAKVTTQFYNKATFRAVANADNTTLLTMTREDYFNCGKSKTGLRVSKSVGTATYDNANSIQTVPVTVTGYHYNDSGRKKPIHAGVFYELLPLDTTVDESSVYVEAGTTLLNRSMVNVEYVTDWLGSGQTMMITSIGMPESIKSPSVSLHYTLTNSYENIIARGTSLYSPSAFANTSTTKEVYEILPKVKRINEIVNGQKVFGEQEQQYGEYVAYASANIKFKGINVSSSGFFKAVNTLNEYAEDAEIIAQTPYTYRLIYGQSDFARSDGIVLYDLIDRGTVTATTSKFYGVTSAWQGTFEDIRIPEVTSEGATCKPVVYYSTTDAQEIKDLPRDLNDTSVWSTTRPSGTVTAIAIDCSKDVNGNDFVLAGSDNIVVYLTMMSPADESLNGKTAVNTAESSSRISSVGGVVEHRNLEYQTTVTMKPVDPVVTLTSTPASGTADEPKLLAYKDTLTYDISVTNPDEVFDYRNIRLEDVLPEGVTPEKGNIFVYVGDDPSTGVKIAASTRASLLLEGDLSSRLAFTIGELLPKETLHIVIPCIVDTKEGKIDNEATLTQVSGLDKDLHTEATHHEVKQYDVLFGKKKLGVEPEEFLGGAHLELLDASGGVVDSWRSSDAAGDEHHAVRIGAGEYTLQEMDAPRDYAIADSVMFTLDRDGVVTIRKQEDPLPDRVVNMYDKYIAVDAVIQNHVSGEDADPNKEFVYSVALTGLKPNETYAAGSKTITADRLGNATLELALKGDERVTLSKLPTGAEVVVTQAGTEYATSYTATVTKDDKETLLHSGETSINRQDLVTQGTKVDVDQGTLHIDFQNVRNANTVPVRFVVLDAQDDTPVVGSSLRIAGPEPAEGEEQFRSEWVSDKEHKRVDLPQGTSYTLTQLAAPEGYLSADGELTIVVDNDGTVSCSDPEAITQDQHGYVVTLKNVRQAHVCVQNMNLATNFFLAGAKLELLKGDDLYTAKRVEAWTSSGEVGKDLYLEAGAHYFVRKTSSPEGCVSVKPTVVNVVVDANRTVTVDPTSSYDAEDETITLWDRYVETLAITNKVTGADLNEEFPYVVSGLTAGDTYSYVLTDDEGKTVEGTLTVNEDGQVAFGLRPNATIVIRDLPHDIQITEAKPEGHYYNTEWVQDETEVLEAEDTQQSSTVSTTLTGRNAIVVTNKECVARVRNRTAEREWSDWTYFEYLATDTNDGAFDYANGLTGDVEVETLWETHERYNMSQGFEFTNSDITSLAIRSTDDLAKAGKHTTIVGASSSSLLTFNTRNPVKVDDLEFDGNQHAQTSDGGAISLVSGSLTLTNTDIHDFETQGRGGAVYVGDGAELTINEGTSLTGCSATSGGAIYAAHEDGHAGALVINGGTITGNTTLQEGHGAVEAASMQFDGTVKVIDNINSAIDGAANVLLDKNSNEVIRTLRLEEDSQIGVYVSDDQDIAHGGSGDPFGTYTVDQNLGVFTNDKNGLYAEAADDPSARRIIWHANESNLPITNPVTGEHADLTRPFNITLTSATLAGQTILLEGSDQPVVFDDNGVATLSLVHGGQATLLGLPDGTSMSVVAQENVDYATSYVVTQGDATSDDARNLTLKSGTDTQVDITHAFSGVPATGLVQNVVAWSCLVLVSALGMAASWAYRRRRP
ncbi:MAG: InlB B-repeat-containing protein [Atopobiaceae bacterium]|nr:InlB B-repeat-containing protein [Atopobiaceae bacterium]